VQTVDFCRLHSCVIVLFVDEPNDTQAATYEPSYNDEQFEAENNTSFHSEDQQADEQHQDQEQYEEQQSEQQNEQDDESELQNEQHFIIVEPEQQPETVSAVRKQIQQRGPMSDKQIRQFNRHNKGKFHELL
jgi:septin family protein